MHSTFYCGGMNSFAYRVHHGDRCCIPHAIPVSLQGGGELPFDWQISNQQIFVRASHISPKVHFHCAGHLSLGTPWQMGVGACFNGMWGFRLGYMIGSTGSPWGDPKDLFWFLSATSWDLPQDT